MCSDIGVGHDDNVERGVGYWELAGRGGGLGGASRCNLVDRLHRILAIVIPAMSRDPVLMSGSLGVRLRAGSYERYAQ